MSLAFFVAFRLSVAVAFEHLPVTAWEILSLVLVADIGRTQGFHRGCTQVGERNPVESKQLAKPGQQVVDVAEMQTLSWQQEREGPCQSMEGLRRLYDQPQTHSDL